MASLPDTARECVDLASAAAPAMLERAIDQAILVLQEEERRSASVPERRALADAWLELSRRRADWAQRFPALLRTAQATLREAPAATAAVQADADDRFGG